MAHVIEHLFNGDEVIPLLLTKLKSKGYFYIEYPGQKVCDYLQCMAPLIFTMTLHMFGYIVLMN